MTGRKKTAAGALAAAAVLALTATALGARSGGPGATTSPSQPKAAAQAGAYQHEFRGSVTGVSRSGSWFQLRTSQGSLVRVHVGPGTYWDDCNWGTIRPGQRIDVRANSRNGFWTAATVGAWYGNSNYSSGYWGDGCWD